MKKSGTDLTAAEIDRRQLREANRIAAALRRQGINPDSVTKNDIEAGVSAGQRFEDDTK